MFDAVLNQLHDGAPVDATIGAMMSNLQLQRNLSSEDGWRNKIVSGVRGHSVYPVLLEDPFVRHSARRPRGYPGDAELLDYVYGSANVGPMIDSASGLGRQLNKFHTHTPPAAAVRNRLRITAAEVDRMAAAGERPQVLSIACGHLREASLLCSLHNRALGRLVGVDQDPLSVEQARRDWGHLGVDVRRCDARTIIHHGLDTLGNFDFIYTLGLYD